MSLFFWDVNSAMVVDNWRFGTSALASRVKQSKSWIAWPLKTGPRGCPETSLSSHERCLKTERSEELSSQSLNFGETAE